MLLRGFLFIALLGGPVGWAQRVISTSPSLTELNYQLGLGERLVGVSDYSDYPEAAKPLPRIGALFNPSIEKTLQLKPDWIWVDAFTQNPSYLQALEALKYKYKVFRIENIEKLFEASEEMLKIANGTLDVVAPQRERVKALRAKAKPFTFLMLTWADPAIAASRRTFYSSLFEMIGGENQVPATIQAPYVPLSREWLLENTPDFVFVLTWEGRDNVKTAASYFTSRKTKVFPLSQDHFARPNFSGLDGIDKISELLWR